MSGLMNHIRQRLIIRRMKAILDYLSPMMSARTSCDERGRFVSGLGSQAVAVRAAEVHEPWVRPWVETEGAKLILQVIADDAAGDRSLLILEAVDCGVEDEIIRRAKQMARGWARSMSDAYPG